MEQQLLHLTAPVYVKLLLGSWFKLCERVIIYIKKRKMPRECHHLVWSCERQSSSVLPLFDVQLLASPASSALNHIWQILQ